ncbi:septal ring lytic transglycosylase RlpA family protein [Dyella sp. A6]|uniref:septal ring lytic transglycosylase RlpA family protein n=1 Tax=Dyella aluminiiresistens TaxID=3069105 RepID=UPI002E78FCE6|nr:septal ring lytic transglycosylase RlpA family protein [Dyella sp. A6]
MRQAIARLAVLAGLALLAGCAGQKATRPVAEPASVPASQQHGWLHRHLFHDDTSLPQDERYSERSDSTPGGPPPAFIATLPEPVPKAEPRSPYGNKSTYSVRGRTYHVLRTAAGYDQRGIASYYGSKFNGYKTSDLEDYDMYKFSAASKVLPLPSYARVTNLANGKSVIVRVNDRGPFHENRIIDLSYAAAVRIGIWPRGTGLVEVQGIDTSGNTRELPPPPVVSRGSAPPGLYLQVGAFADPANAERVASRLRRAGLAPVHVVQAVVGGRRVQRVRLGPLPDVDTADRVASRVERMGLPHPEVAVD